MNDHDFQIKIWSNPWLIVASMFGALAVLAVIATLALVVAQGQQVHALLTNGRSASALIAKATDREVQRLVAQGRQADRTLASVLFLVRYVHQSQHDQQAQVAAFLATVERDVADAVRQEIRRERLK